MKRVNKQLLSPAVYKFADAIFKTYVDTWPYDKWRKYYKRDSIINVIWSSSPQNHSKNHQSQLYIRIAYGIKVLNMNYCNPWNVQAFSLIYTFWGPFLLSHLSNPNYLLHSFLTKGQITASSLDPNLSHDVHERINDFKINYHPARS